MAKELVAVKIVHDIVNRVVYNLYAEFFRFSGIYVGEGIIDQYSDKEAEQDKDCFQLFLCICDMKVPNKISDEIMNHPSGFVFVDAGKYKDLSLQNVSRWKNLDQAMLRVLKQLEMKAKANTILFPMKDLLALLPIFIGENILKASCQIQYYRMKSEMHKETENIFYNALVKLEKFPVSTKYIDYAKLFCKQKMNLSCYLQKNKKLDFPIKELCQECEDLFQKYPDFSNAYVLLGMICEKSHDNETVAISAYRKALEMVGDKCYASHIYYWIGVLYQKFINGHDRAKSSYLSAYECKRKYRNVYKLGSVYCDEKDYLTTIAYFKECLELLSERLEINMDPLEIEYYYKTGALICIYSVLKLQKYEEGIAYGKKMLEFYENDLINSRHKYFEYYFEGQAAEYQKISRNRISREKVYVSLAIAHRELGQLEEADKYWELSEKES